jgi:glutamine synthetase type III
LRFAKVHPHKIQHAGVANADGSIAPFLQQKSVFSPHNGKLATFFNANTKRTLLICSLAAKKFGES